MSESTEKERPDYSGMTVNERLFHAGLTEAFDDAIHKKDRDRAVGILKNVDVPAPEKTVDAIFAHPKLYGF